jgi:hypothetical protein
VAATGGYALAFRIAAALPVVGGVLVMLLLEEVAAQPRNPAAELTPERR